MVGLLEPKENKGWGWYIATRKNDFTYLHSDGLLHDSTHYKGKATGYFKTFEEALKAYNKYYGLHPPINQMELL